MGIDDPRGRVRNAPLGNASVISFTMGGYKYDSRFVKCRAGFPHNIDLRPPYRNVVRRRVQILGRRIRVMEVRYCGYNRRAILYDCDIANLAETHYSGGCRYLLFALQAADFITGWRVAISTAWGNSFPIGTPSAVV